jgi:hypothetical protein
VRLKEAGILDWPDTNPKIRTEGSGHYIRIHALAPSNRPVQVTENLALFRRETYDRLRKVTCPLISSYTNSNPYWLWYA